MGKPVRWDARPVWPGLCHAKALGLRDGGSGLGRHVGGEGGSGTVDDKATLKRHSTV
jgi:hypothetical protein